MTTMLFLGLLALATPASSATPTTTVHIKNFAFAPSIVHIHQGDTVAFVNDDEEPHTVTSLTRTFDSGGLDSADRWTHTFAKRGTFAYYCTVHPMMHGKVVVLARTAQEQR